VNDTTYAIHDRESWAGIDLDRVDALSIEAVPLDEVDHATLIALDEYCSLLAECLERREPAPLQELAEELPYVRTRLGAFFPSLRDERGAVPALNDAALVSGRLPAPAAAETVLAEIRSLRSLLASREREYRQPARELALTLGQLSGFTATLIEVPVQLQTGKEVAAMEAVVRLSELLGRVVRLIPLAEKRGAESGVDLAATRAFATETSPHLAELKEALEIQDTVLIGDLLEYEIAPRLERLGELLVGGEATT